ncbi:MAG TPA: DHA2 family efflux MFS transporter permease subunit [Syntrophobacteria bacterium]|nr:DHA2 family efflux MFS transporter permease subunit [Syntrophobacteria bacterium]
MTDAPKQRVVNKWVVAMAVILPTFIEVMDTSVVNVSLPHIQGSLNAGLDEVTWVLTSYLVSNAIIIPITGWLASVFGRKRYLLFSIITFTISSIACGSAPTLPVLIIARIFQGLGGGGLQPLSQAILFETFPVAEHGLAMAVFGMGVVMAPVIGPVLGGWITDTLTWRWVFYINLPIGAVAVALAMLFVFDPEYIRRKRIHIDTWGLFLLTVGLGSLQIVLDKGEREDWFNSSFIVMLSAMAVLSLVLFVIVELRTEHPVVNLRVFRDRNFFAGNVCMFTGFGCMFGSFVLLPLYAQNLMNYTAFWAGLVLGPGGVASFMIMPIAGVLMRRGVNPRNLLAMGLTVLASTIWLMSRFNLEAGFLAIATPRLLQGFGLGLFFVPLATATFMTIPKEATGNASGIFNLLRNLGGSVGVALSTTLLSQRAQVHQTFLVERITPYNAAFQIRFEQILQWLRTYHADMASSHTALALVYRELGRQANMLAFNDTFWILACMTAAVIPLTLLFRQGKAAAPPGAAH